MDDDPFKWLYDAVSAICGYEAEPFPYSVSSAQGETVQIRNPDGSWVKSLWYESICRGSRPIDWPEEINSNPVVEWSIRHFVIHRLKSRVESRPSNAVVRAAQTLDAHGLTTPKDLGEAIGSWARSLLERAVDERLAPLKEGLVAYIDFCIDSDIAGFDDAMWAKIHRFRLHDLGRIDLRMFDEDGGPYTPAELSSINDAIRNCEALTPPDKAAILLCRDWGFRPIQIALLAATDFNEDAAGPFVMVSSAKGLVHSKMRRHPENKKKRYIADDTARAVKDTLEWYADLVNERLAYIASRSSIGVSVGEIMHPIFPRARCEARLSRYLDDRRLRPYAIMTDACAISVRLRDTTTKIAIPLEASGASLLEISASRFRYTKGTMLALQGYPVEYIAEALDHQSAYSIKHYFRYTMQLAAYMNSVAMRSPEIQSAAKRWQGKLLSAEEATQCIAQGDRAVTDLGICKKGGPCGFWPTVTCYSCSRFRPCRDADHRQAAEHIAREQQSYEVSAGKTSSHEFQVAHERALALALIVEKERQNV